MAKYRKIGVLFIVLTLVFSVFTLPVSAEETGTANSIADHTSVYDFNSTSGEVDYVGHIYENRNKILDYSSASPGSGEWASKGAPSLHYEGGSLYMTTRVRNSSDRGHTVQIWEATDNYADPSSWSKVMEHNLKANMSEVVSVERFSIQYDEAAGRWLGYIAVDSSSSSLNWTMYKVGNTDFSAFQSDINTFSEWTTVKKTEDIATNPKDGTFFSHPQGQSQQKFLLFDDIGSGFGLDIISDANTASGGAFFDSGATEVGGIRDSTSLTYSDYNAGTIVYDSSDSRYIHIQSFQQSGDTEKETYQVAKNLTTDTVWNRTNTRTFDSLYSPPKNNRRYHDYVVISGQEYWVYSEDSDSDNVYETYISDNSEPNSAPSASFSTNVSSPAPNESIEFNASDSTDDSSISSYEWDFDNDSNYEQTGEVVTNSYSQEGDYNVTLKVTDGGGLTDTVTKTISVGDSGGGGTAPSEDNQTLYLTLLAGAFIVFLIAGSGRGR